MSTNHTVAVCVGHSRSNDDGAVSTGGVSEWAFNDGLANLIVSKLERSGVPAIKVNKYEGHGYGAAMRWVAGELSRRFATIAIELHFNSADTETANGHEWLYWASSARSKRLAEAIRDAYVEEFPIARSRGAIPKRSGDRGAEFLRLTPCPAVICEPFFGSNPVEWATAVDRKDALADAITSGIQKYLA